MKILTSRGVCIRAGIGSVIRLGVREDVDLEGRRAIWKSPICRQEASLSIQQSIPQMGTLDSLSATLLRTWEQYLLVAVVITALPLLQVMSDPVVN